MATEIVISPEVPDRDRSMLRSAREDWRRPDEVPIKPVGIWYLVAAVGWNGLAFLFVGSLVGVIGAMIASTIGSVPLLPFVLAFHLPDATLGWVAFPAAAVGFLGGARFGLSIFRESRYFMPLRRERLCAFRHHGKYVAAERLDEKTRHLLERADAACTAVLASRVHGAGLLDEIANQVVLPDELWQIAELLQRQSILEGKQAEARALAGTPELKAVMKPQREALAVSRARVTAKIEALEEYARRVALADSVHAASELASENEEYLALLTHTDDRTAVAELSAEVIDLHAVLADVHAAAALVGDGRQPV